mmetsp:Transcript_1785/g.2332  ORF Transcript_1785/g.2332 Transcript_1785/m.2332 type:complete len:98 (-) Transcript_1785:280-573(-)
MNLHESADHSQFAFRLAGLLSLSSDSEWAGKGDHAASESGSSVSGSGAKLVTALTEVVDASMDNKASPDDRVFSVKVDQVIIKIGFGFSIISRGDVA